MLNEVCACMCVNQNGGEMRSNKSANFSSSFKEKSKYCLHFKIKEYRY